MIKFLETEEISTCIKRIITNAKKQVILVSPYLKIADRLKNYIEEKSQEKVEIVFVYREINFDVKDDKWARSLNKNVYFVQCKDLHAKCYMNETEAVITSMNLYEYSQVHNYEMGIFASNQEDVYKKISESVERVIKHSLNDLKKVNQSHNGGVCIRCEKAIPLDGSKPYCYDCYLSWEQYENYDYTEKYCHSCGKREGTSMSKPVCYDCYKEGY